MMVDESFEVLRLNKCSSGLARLERWLAGEIKLNKTGIYVDTRDCITIDVYVEDVLVSQGYYIVKDSGKFIVLSPDEFRQSKYFQQK